MNRREFLLMLGALGLGATLVKFDGFAKTADEALADQSLDLNHVNDVFVYAQATENIPAYSVCWIDNGQASLLNTSGTNFKARILGVSTENVKRGDSVFFNTGKASVRVKVVE